MRDYREFIVAKCELFDRAFGSSNFTYLFFGPGARYTGPDPTPLSRAQAKNFEAGIERIASGDPATLASARAELRRRFGFDRIGVDPEVVLQRVLKRGRIRSDKEAEIIRDAVANQTNESLLGAEAYERLAAILDEAGY